jgi:CDP-4-dehydro-6-deoxyglucose reductase
MFKINLRNGKSFTCHSNITVFEAAKKNGIILEHSCLKVSCKSCAVRIESGTTLENIL